MAFVNLFDYSAAVRGYHYYRNYLQPQPEQNLVCSHKKNNPCDLFAIKVAVAQSRMLVIYCQLLLDPFFRGVSKSSAKSKKEIFVTKVKTFVTKISMLDFAEVLDKPLILLGLGAQSSRSQVFGRGGVGLSLFALCNFNFQIWCEFETWPADNLLKTTLYMKPSVSQPAHNVTRTSSYGLIFRTFFENRKNLQYLIFQYLIHTFDGLKLKILPQKCIQYLCSKSRPEDVPKRSPSRSHFGTFIHSLQKHMVRKHYYNFYY